MSRSLHEDFRRTMQLKVPLECLCQGIKVCFDPLCRILARIAQQSSADGRETTANS